MLSQGVIELLKKNILNRELGYQCQLDIEEQLARQAASVVGGALLHSHACLCNGLASVIDGRLVSASFWALFDKRGPADSKKSELVAFLCQVSAKEEKKRAVKENVLFYRPAWK